MSQTGCSNRSCEWEPTTCAQDQATCATVPGCVVSEASCQYAEFGDSCGQHGTMASCASTVNDPCVWTAAQKCASACSTATDQQSCQNFSVTDPAYPTQPMHPCAWSTCSGTPIKQPCDQYPINSCPASLECYVDMSDPIGT